MHSHTDTMTLSNTYKLSKKTNSHRHLITQINTQTYISRKIEKDPAKGRGRRKKLRNTQIFNKNGHIFIYTSNT